MGFDVPSLMSVTALVIFLSTIVLLAHWVANFSFAGLGKVTSGVGLAGIGTVLLILGASDTASIKVLPGILLVILAHAMLWLGLVDFWHERTRATTYLVGGIFIISVLTLGYSWLEGRLLIDGRPQYSIYIAIFSIGSTYAVVKALGGRIGLYKGIIKRKTIGASTVAGVLFGHGVFNLYRSILIYKSEPPGVYFDNTEIASLTQLEGLLFVLGLTISLIVCTAERVQADLRIQAMMDPLTQALNRRAFMTVIKTVLARSRRLSEPVSLVMMDIDKFKQINLKHGHLVGDAILGQFSEGVIEGRRAQDVFCRFGGEEFVLLLPGTEEEGSELVARRVRDAVTGYPFRYANKDISLTVSFGVTTARGDDLVADSILASAYRALRAAQKQGRNHIEVDRPEKH